MIVWYGETSKTFSLNVENCSLSVFFESYLVSIHVLSFLIYSLNIFSDQESLSVTGGGIEENKSFSVPVCNV